MFKIRLIKDLRTMNGWIKAGEEMEARILPGGMTFEIGRPYQVISGTYSGYEIPQTHAVVIPKEKLFTEHQYNAISNELLRVREELRETKERNSYLERKSEADDQALYEWDKSWEALWEKFGEEKRLLQEEINGLVAVKKVALPKDVATAINKEFGKASELVKRWGFYNIISLEEKWLNRNGRIIKQHFREEDYLQLAAAISHGCVVQESPQERIKRGVQEIYEKWTTIESSGSDQADGADLAEQITNFVSTEMKL
jgi:hypothetical protein